MILEAIMSIIKIALEFIFGLLPSLEVVQLPIGFMEWFANIIHASAYFLPLSDFLIMFGIWFTVTNWQIIWKVLTRIWDALPFT